MTQPNKESQCPAISADGVSCVKPLYFSQSGEYWEHAGGHVYATRETLRRLDEWHYDAGALLAGEAVPLHAPEDCLGPEFCITARLGLK